MKQIRKKAVWILLVAMLALLTAGCKQAEPKHKIRDLDFTVIDETEIPEALKHVIDENHQTEMKLSYQNEGCLYIARGFGKQDTGGYSIQVTQCYLAEDGIHVAFELLGPPHEGKIKEEPSFPYIVIKTEGLEETILFD